jgi:hypothetical protein
MTGAPAGSILLLEISLFLRSASFCKCRIPSEPSPGFSCKAQYTVPCVHAFAAPNTCYFTLQSVNAIRVFANIKYEVDEIRRDITVCKLAKDNRILPNFSTTSSLLSQALLSTTQANLTQYVPVRSKNISSKPRIPGPVSISTPVVVRNKRRHRQRRHPRMQAHHL